MHTLPSPRPPHSQHTFNSTAGALICLAAAYEKGLGARIYIKPEVPGRPEDVGGGGWRGQAAGGFTEEKGHLQSEGPGPATGQAPSDLAEGLQLPPVPLEVSLCHLLPY